MYLKINSNVAFDGEELFPGDFVRTKSKRLLELGKAEESTEADYKKWLKNKDRPSEDKPTPKDSAKESK